MKLSEIYGLLDEVAPKALSDELCAKHGFYDNSGILVNTGDEIEGALFTLDLTREAVEKAIEVGANLIVTHHPVIYGKIGSVDALDKGLGERLTRCIRAGISVVSMHLNLDSAKGGIDESLARGVCLAAGESEGAGLRLTQIQHLLTGGGYGRAYDLSGVRLGALADGVKSVFESERVEVYGDENRQIRRAASFCGAGADEGSVAFALSTGADVMISSDFKHHIILQAKEAGLAVITLTHYASENYGFKKYYEKISRRAGVPCVYHEERDLL